MLDVYILKHQFEEAIALIEQGRRIVCPRFFNAPRSFTLG